MFYGHPVEKLCTYQYSLITLVPGLLQNLDDCGSPPLARRSKTLSRPTELRTSDPKSMMNWVGLPLDLFGKVLFVSDSSQDGVMNSENRMPSSSRIYRCNSSIC